MPLPRRPSISWVVTVPSLALVLAACGGSSSGAGTAAAPVGSPAASTSSEPTAAAGSDPIGCAKARGKTVGYSEPLPDPNFQEIERIMKVTLDKYGVDLKAVNANLDPGKQISDIQALIQSKVAVLVANPIDPNATKAGFDKARAAGIPVIAQETTVGGPFFTNVGADVEAAAAGGAQDLKAAVGDGKVGAIIGPPIAEVLTRQANAFAAKAKEIGLNVVDTQTNARITPQAAKGFADAWKQKLGAGLKGVWTFNDVSAIGVASSTGGDFTPAIVSINAQPDAIPLVQSGKLLATYDIQQDKLGQMLAYASLQSICGGKVPESIWIPVVKYDKGNVGQWKPLSERGNEPLTSVAFEERDGKNYLK